MTKQEQKQVNQIVLQKIDEFANAKKTVHSVKALRHCDAMVYEYVSDETGEVIYALQSYKTVVALIYGNCVYDFLRYVYGYTARSAQHIAKFIHDYIDCYYPQTNIYRYYPIGD